MGSKVCGSGLGGGSGVCLLDYEIFTVELRLVMRAVGKCFVCAL